jgi:hypothetical protein
MLPSQINYMYRQVKRLSDLGNDAWKAAESRAFNSQAHIYPVLAFSDAVIATMGFSTGHYAEGAAHAVRAGLDLVMWNLVLKGPASMDPNFKYWATVGAVGGSMAASAAAYYAHYH